MQKVCVCVAVDYADTQIYKYLNGFHATVSAGLESTQNIVLFLNIYYLA